MGSVLEAAVVGRSNPDGLVKPHASVVLKDGQIATDALAEELRRFVRTRIAGYKVPASITFVDDLPKTSTGKIQRFRLRQ